MDYICNDTLVFFQEGGGTDKIKKLHEAFQIFPCNDSEDIDPNWIGFLTRKELNINDDIDDRCLFIDAFIEDDNTLLVYSQSINSPKIDVYDRIAEYFELKYHLLAEEPENQIFINTDIERKYFDNEFAVIIISDDAKIIEDLQQQLSESYSSIETLLEDFAAVGYKASNIKELKELLKKEANEILEIKVIEYQTLRLKNL